MQARARASTPSTELRPAGRPATPPLELIDRRRPPGCPIEIDDGLGANDDMKSRAFSHLGTWFGYTWRHAYFIPTLLMELGAVGMSDSSETE